jgi:hypothetical protein
MKSSSPSGPDFLRIIARVPRRRCRSNRITPVKSASRRPTSGGADDWRRGPPTPQYRLLDAIPEQFIEYQQLQDLRQQVLEIFAQADTLAEQLRRKGSTA